MGKTFVACALAQHALRRRYRAIYRRTSRLFDELALARADGTYARLLVRLARVDVLILDDWGMAPSARPNAATCPIADAICDRLLSNCHRIVLNAHHAARRSPPRPEPPISTASP